VTIPDNLEVPLPLTKSTFPGGLYAAVTITPANKNDGGMIGVWLQNSDEYMNDQGSNGPWQEARPAHEVYFNPLNIYGLKNTDIFNSVFNPEYIDIHVPIREKEKVTDEKMAELSALEELALRGSPIEIDLTSMVKNSDDFTLSYSDNMMIIKSETDYHGGVSVPQTFHCPMKIELRAKTDNTDLCVSCMAGLLNINAGDFGKPLVLFGSGTDKIYPYNTKDIPANEFIDLEWILGKNVMAIKVNGELRVLGNEYGYIQTLNENPESCLSHIQITSARNATITVERLCITEL